MNYEPNILNFKPNYKLWLIIFIFYSSFCYLFYTSFFITSYNKLFHDINYGYKVIAVFFIILTLFMFLFPIIMFFIFFSINKIDLENKKIINIRYFGLKTKIIDFSQIIGIKLLYATSSQSKLKYRIISLIVNADEAYNFSCFEVTNFNEYLETLPNYFKFLRSENFNLTDYRYYELNEEEKKQLFKDFEKEERSLILERIFDYSILVLFFGYVIYLILENNNVDSYEFKIKHLNIIPLGLILIYGIKRIIYYTKSLINEDTYMYKFLRKEINK